MNGRMQKARARVLHDGSGATVAGDGVAAQRRNFWATVVDTRTAPHLGGR